VLQFLITVWILGIIPMRFFLSSRTSSDSIWGQALIWPIPFGIWAVSEYKRRKAQSSGPSGPSNGRAAPPPPVGFSGGNTPRGQDDSGNDFRGPTPPPPSIS
jgi:hypothetical protein